MRTDVQDGICSSSLVASGNFAIPGPRSPKAPQPDVILNSSLNLSISDSLLLTSSCAAQQGRDLYLCQSVFTVKRLKYQRLLHLAYRPADLSTV